MSEHPMTDGGYRVHGVLVRPDGTTTPWQVHPSLAGIVEVVGDRGWLGRLTLTPAIHAWSTDDRAGGSRVPVNRPAMATARNLGWQGGGELRGPVLFLGHAPGRDLADLPGWADRFVRRRRLPTNPPDADAETAAEQPADRPEGGDLP